MVDVCFGDQMKKFWRAHMATHDIAVGLLVVSTTVVVIFISGWLLYQSLYGRQISYLAWPKLSAMKRKTLDQDVSRSCLGETSHRSGAVTENDPILEPKHKIFLSHSGAQKEFVDHLCKALEDRCRYPFFDRRRESLPKGEQFPELIVLAAEQCEMLIVVVSDEYFMSKWPMIELSAFVQAHKLHRESKSSIRGPKILPLFYGLSVGDLGDARMQNKWFRKWKTLAKADLGNRIIVSDWKYALHVLRSFNGLPYDKNSKESVAYIEKIVSDVCESIPSDIRWDDSHVQGKSNICKVIGEKVEEIGVSKQYNMKVVGVYGVGGVGKTTICLTLCNELSSKYEGRVCHIEFPSEFQGDPSNYSKELFQKAVRDLTRKSWDDIQHLNEGECTAILRGSLFKYKTFLAIDNFSDCRQSIELAKTFLGLPYHMDSLVVVTARSQCVLERLRISQDACLEMPNLCEADAMKLFLQHATSGQAFSQDGDMYDIKACVRRCYFSKGGGGGHHYHPLALKSLGLQLGFLEENPSLWVEHLPDVKNFDSLPGGNPVFGILRSGFDLLSLGDQTLFMDLRWIFFNLQWVFFDLDNRKLLLSILCTLHGKDEKKISQRLEDLKRKGLLEHVDLKSGKVSMHSLYWEFAKLEAQGSFNKPTNMERMSMYIENGDLEMLQYKPTDGHWVKLIRLIIVHSKYGGSKCEIGSLEGIKWKYFCNVQVLHLDGVHLKPGALNLEVLMCLRILTLKYVRGIDQIEGLGELKNLTHFIGEFDLPSDGPNIYIVGQLPSSLKVLKIEGFLEMESKVLEKCHGLVTLSLMWVEAPSLDLRNCLHLESVNLLGIQKLKTLEFTSRQSCNLQSLKVLFCHYLVDIQEIHHLIGLKELEVQGNLEWRCPSLLALTKLQVLTVREQERLVIYSKDSIPCQLQELHWIENPLSNQLNLGGFTQLEVLDLRGNHGFTSLVELGDLPSLHIFNLERCKHLLQLPDLSKSRILKELKLGGCFALKLYERDIQMLFKLPLLQPLPLSTMFGIGQSFALDIHRRKVLVYNDWLQCSSRDWKANELVEQDLGPPPILIGMGFPFTR